MNLIEKLNRLYTTSRQSTLTVDGFESLTIISGVSCSGKNTLLAGLALNYPVEHNHVICVESYVADCGGLGKVASFYSEVVGFDLGTVVGIVSESPAKNIFIEQYHRGSSSPFEDMKTLIDLGNSLGKKIHICVHRPRTYS